jgi:pimeloyl-ACP methyl ester carboxylesterase
MAAALPDWQAGQLDSERWVAAMDSLIAHRAEALTSLRWMLSNALWVFGVATAQELLDEVAKYDLTHVADQITCPTLVCEAENDQFFLGQPSMLYEALHCPKTCLTFSAAEGAGEHCHEGALTLFHQRMFDWLDDTLRT